MEGSSAATSAVEHPCSNVFSASISAGLSGFASLRILTPSGEGLLRDAGDEIRGEDDWIGEVRFLASKERERRGFGGAGDLCEW